MTTKTKRMRKKKVKQQRRRGCVRIPIKVVEEVETMKVQSSSYLTTALLSLPPSLSLSRSSPSPLC